MPQDDAWFWGPTVGGGETTKPQPVARGKKVEEHPRRPGEPDCSYFVKFGSCKFGMSCVYNHPDPRQHGGDDKQPEQFPRRPGEPDCSYYVKFGSCKFGMNCRFNHPPRIPVPSQEYFPGNACHGHHHEGKSKVEQVKLNGLGLPLRPGTGLCSYYMNRGICKFGTNCKFDHPDPGSDQEKWVDSSNANQVSSQPVNPSFQLAERLSYTRDQLLQLCQNVDVPKNILELCQDINVVLTGEDKILGFRAEKNHVQTPSYKRFDATDSRDWHSRSAQTHLDNFSEAKEPYALGWKQEQFNKHDQTSNHFDSKAQSCIISEKDEVLTTLKRILNTLTPKMFDLQKGQLIETKITSADILKDVLNLIFEKVVAEPAFCPTYAQLCSYLNQNLTPFPPEDCDGEKITFKQALSNKCQEIFESDRTVRAEIDKLIGPDQEMEQRDKERVVKLETLGNIHFIRALLKKKLITNKIIDHIVQAVMDCGKFRFEPLGKVDLLNIIFEGMLDSDSAGAEPNICVNAMIGGNKSFIAANNVEMTYKNVNRRNEEEILQKSYNEVPNKSMDPQKNYADAAFSHLTVNVPKDIMKLVEDTNVLLHGEDESWAPNEINYVPTLSYKRFNETDSRDWHSRSLQTSVVVKEEKSWDDIRKAKEPCALGWKEKQFNKQDQISFQFDSKAQVGPTSALHKAEDPWPIRRGTLREKDEVLETIKGILNLSRPEKFDALKGQLIEAGITRTDILKDVINLILEKADAEPTLCSMYAQLCSYLSEHLTAFPPGDTHCEEITFKQALSNKCQEAFEIARNVRAGISKLTGQDQEIERRDKERLVKHQTLGNICLIRDLLKGQMVTDKILHYIVQAVMDCEKFHFEPLENVDLLNIIFDGVLDSVLAGTETNKVVNVIVGSEKFSISSNDFGIIDKDINRRNEDPTLQESSNDNLNNSMHPQRNYVLNPPPGELARYYLHLKPATTRKKRDREEIVVLSLPDRNESDREEEGNNARRRAANNPSMATSLPNFL
uniref:C3H1-type domain-containing protein n=1 Tax=Oryza punctata TaxID=4537 RepID=A0A0E0LC36_ORYPU